MFLSGGEDWEDLSGAYVILHNSTFLANRAGLDNGGVLNLDEFSRVNITGDGNVFTENKCAISGGVLAASINTRVTVEGGEFNNNEAGEVSSGVVGLDSSFKLAVKYWVKIPPLFFFNYRAVLL